MEVSINIVGPCLRSMRNMYREDALMLIKDVDVHNWRKR